jgi:hypothetical protein
LLWREAAGRNPVGYKWIYVTDGGHYDDLGLVEALRRHPRRIFLLDASGDPGHSYRALGQAIALARSELGVQIQIDPLTMEPSSDPGQGAAQAGAQVQPGQPLPGRRPPDLRQAHVCGRFRYTTGPAVGRSGTISMIKLGVWPGDDLPWDVRAYYEDQPTFPRSSTVQQLYDDQDFEAYRELGAAAMRALLASCRQHQHRRHDRHRSASQASASQASASQAAAPVPQPSPHP